MKIQFTGEHRGIVNYTVGNMRHAFGNRDGYREKEVPDNYAKKIMEKHPGVFKVAAATKPAKTGETVSTKEGTK